MAALLSKPGKFSRLAFLFLFLLLLSLFVTRTYAPSYQQDNSSFVVFGNASGSPSDLDTLDGVSWNVTTSSDTELGLKTVEFFIGQDNSTGIPSGTTKIWNSSIFLPEDSIAVDSAIIEVSMKPSAATITAGSVSIDGGNSTAIPLMQATGPLFRMLYRYNATLALANFTNGTNSFTMSVGVTGPIIYQENAKLILTYRYNRNSETQLRTVKFFAGADRTSKAVGSDTTSKFRVNLPEVSPSVKSAWIENAASIPAAVAAVSTYNLSIDDNYHLGGLTHANVLGTYDILVFYNATPFYSLGQGWSPEYTLKMRSSMSNNLNLWGAEAVLTYAYNATAIAALTAQKTVSYLAGANTTLITSGSVTNFTFSIRIPEDDPKLESVWFRVTSDTGAASNNFTININGTWAQDFLYSWTSETNGITPMLANGTDALRGLRQGDNPLTLSVRNSASTASALSAEAIVTYNYSASSRTQQESVQYMAYQSFSEANTANLLKTGNFSVTMPATSMNVTSAYLQTDPVISNTGLTLAGATFTDYGTWLNGTGSSFSVATTDENLNVRTLMNATKVYDSESIMAGKTSSWGTNLRVIDENNYVHSAKFKLTYTYDRKSRIETMHNSTQVVSGPLYSVNATIRFMSSDASSWNLSIYNWVQQNWTGCNSTVAHAGVWNTWNCNITQAGHNTADYVSADKIVRIDMNTTNPALAGRLLVDYLRFDLTPDIAPRPQITLPENTTYGTTSLKLNYSVFDENLENVWFLYNGANTTLTGNTTFAALGDQRSTLFLFANDTVGNVNVTNVTFTVSIPVPTATPTAAPPVAGGGGGGIFATATESHTLGQIPAGSTADVAILKQTSLMLDKITIEAKKDIPGGAKMDLDKLDELPAAVTSPPQGAVYAQFLITLSNAEPESIAKATIGFFVEKSWIANGGHASVVLNRWLPLESRWAPLPTKKTHENGTQVYYSAESPGFSIFAITGVAVSTPVPTKTKTPTQTPGVIVVPTSTATSQSPNVTTINTPGAITDVAKKAVDMGAALGKQVNPVGITITVVLLASLLWLAMTSALPHGKIYRHIIMGMLVGGSMLWLLAFVPKLPAKSLIAGLAISLLILAYILLASNREKPGKPEKAIVVPVSVESEKDFVKHYPAHRRW